MLRISFLTPFNYFTISDLTKIIIIILIKLLSISWILPVFSQEIIEEEYAHFAIQKGFQWSLVLKKEFYLPLFFADRNSLLLS